MSKQIIRTNRAPVPVGAYNQAIAASGRMLFVAGQIPINAETSEIVIGDIAQQTKQVMNNIEAILKEAGADWQNVVKTTIFLTDLANFAEVNLVYGHYFSEGFAPARSCVEVSRLPKDVSLEIECIAML